MSSIEATNLIQNETLNQDNLIPGSSKSNLNEDNNKQIEDQTQTSSDNSNNNETKTNQTCVETFLKALNHSVACSDSSCRFERCVQLKRLVQHSNNCQELKIAANQPANSKCEYCRQLIALCIYHAKSCQEDVCQVPHCISIKLKLSKMQEFKVKLESVTDFVLSNLKLLKFKLKTNIQIQTDLDSTQDLNPDSNEQNEINSNRLKFIEKLEKIKSNYNLNLNLNREEKLFKFDKKLRSQLIKNLIDFINNMFDLKLKKFYENLNFALLCVYFIKSEKEIYVKTSNSDDYLCLLSELLFNIELEFKKRINSDKTVQVDGTFNQEIVNVQRNRDDQEEEEDEEEDLDVVPPKKKVKFE